MKFLNFQYILDFIYPAQCSVCESGLHGEKLICNDCWSRLKPVDGIVEQGILERSHLAEIRSGFYYDDAFQKIIHLLKYQHAPVIAHRMAQRLSEIILSESEWRSADWITAVPLHRAKERERGYNQSAEMGKALSKIVQIPFRQELIKRTVNTVSQTQMKSAEERVKNMENVFYADTSGLLQDKIVILIDDVITTGATANACAGILKAVGASKVFMLTAARPVFN